MQNSMLQRGKWLAWADSASLHAEPHPHLREVKQLKNYQNKQKLLTIDSETPVSSMSSFVLGGKEQRLWKGPCFRVAQATGPQPGPGASVHVIHSLSILGKELRSKQVEAAGPAALGLEGCRRGL